MPPLQKELETGGESLRLSSSPTKPLQWCFLLLNSTLILLGSGGPLLLRLYFLHGGKRKWLSSLLQVCGWPSVLLPLSISYFSRRSRRSSATTGTTKLFALPPMAAATCTMLGFLSGLNAYLYAFGSSCLPMSTSSILVSTQLAFTAVFALLIVHQRFTAYTVNSIVLLTLGPVVLSLHAGSDRPANEPKERYYLGFFMTIAAAALVGVVLPMMELVYLKMKERVTFVVVMEMQMFMGVAGSLFCIAGMIVNQDFKVITREAKEFGLGEVKYYVVLLLDAVFWQAMNLGLAGLISSTSSLLGGVLMAVLLPVSEILAVIFFKEKFDCGKGVALALSLWGFVSYLYGETKQSNKLKKQMTTPESQLTSSVP